MTFNQIVGGGVMVGISAWSGITGFDKSVNSSSSGVAPWSMGAATNAVADALFFGMVGIEDATNPTTNTATTGTEIHDLYTAGDQQGMADGYTIATTIASRAIAGTLSNTAASLLLGLLAIYSGSGGAASLPTPARRYPSRGLRMRGR